MINLNGFKEPHAISAFEKITSEGSRYSNVSVMPVHDHRDIKIITHIDDFEALEQEWDGLAWESDTHIFQTYEWNRIWWKHFGKNKKLYIVAVYAENKLAGIAPLFEDDIWLLGRKVYTCLRFIGSHVSQPEGEPLIGRIPYSDYLDCIVHPGYEQFFCELILQHFNTIKSVYDEFILDEVTEESVICNIMIPLLSTGNHGLSCKIRQASSSPVIQMDSTWKAYLNSMNVKDRYNAKRYYNRSILSSDKAFKIKKLKHADELPGVLSDLIRMHQKQWNKRGFSGTFSEKRMCDFIAEITKLFHNLGWMQIYMAYPYNVDNKYIAIDFYMTYKDRVYLMHRGVEEDSIHRKDGPGNVLLYSRIHEAIDDGVLVFDMLRGSEEFKLRMATKININKKITIYANSKTGRVLPGLVNACMKIIRQVQSEKLHTTEVFKDKPVTEGATDYVQFLYKRIKQKFLN